MKKLSSPFTKLIAIAACALTLGSCSRAEYAMLPKGGSYHGTTRPANTVSTSVATTVAATPAAEVAAPKVEATAPVAAKDVAAAPVAAKRVAAAPVAAAPAATKSVSSATVAAAPAAKLTLVQRVAMSKVTKMVQKAATSNKHANTASTQALDSKLRTAILLVAVGLLLEILGIAISSSILYLIGAILIIVGSVFFILWLIDKLS